MLVAVPHVQMGAHVNSSKDPVLCTAANVLRVIMGQGVKRVSTTTSVHLSSYDENQPMQCITHFCQT